jgi:hypothetical protein
MAHHINEQVAGRLEEVARLLGEQGADPYRVRAYRRAAMTVRASAKPVDELFRQRGLAGIRDSLAHRLGAIHLRGVDARPAVPVSELLDVDCEYRQKATAGRLRLIAPRHFNPTGDAWLPVLHTERGNRHYTALYSNTARAHRAGKTRDWVVLYHDDGAGERLHTVLTATRGVLSGRRLVAGRESECLAYYSSAAA